jgi:hypothetical protein
VRVLESDIHPFATSGLLNIAKEKKPVPEATTALAVTLRRATKLKIQEHISEELSRGNYDT